MEISWSTSKAKLRRWSTGPRIIKYKRCMETADSNSRFPRWIHRFDEDPTWVWLVPKNTWGCCEFLEVVRRGFGTVFFEICFLEANWSDDDDDDDDEEEEEEELRLLLLVVLVLVLGCWWWFSPAWITLMIMSMLRMRLSLCQWSLSLFR